MEFPIAVITVIPVTNENKLDKQTDYSQENECNKQDQNVSAKEFGDKDATNPNNSLYLDNKREQIEKFFTSYDGHEEEHMLEESVCKELMFLN